MGSRLGRRVIHFANLPIKLLLPKPPFSSIREFALKTIPSASKIEIRRILESLYGFDVDDVRTLNMEGKKKKRGGFLAAKPDYKKAYVTLKSPLSISPDLFPIPWVQEAMQQKLGNKAKPSVVVGDDDDDDAVGSDSGKGRGHWMDEEKGERRAVEMIGGGKKKMRGSGRGKTVEESRFPWSSMRSWKRRHLHM